MKNLIPLFVLCFLVSIGCNRESVNEDEAISDFIAENNLIGEFVEDGIFVSIENPGNGKMPTSTDRVSVFYEGKYASDGKVFDGNLSSASPIEFSLQGVIRGWTKGLPYFGEGDKGWLVLPSDQAYGSNPPSGVRKNAPMAFYIELVSVK
jgi:FKBP-type peptidyl-prolyl cis-trans isomerase FkpA